MKAMQSNKRNVARKRAFYRLRDKYPRQYEKFYIEELGALDLKPRKKKRKPVKETDVTPEQVEKIIAERMMTTEYLGALMQEGVVSNRKLDIDIEPVDVTFDKDYSPLWDKSAWIVKDDRKGVE